MKATPRLIPAGAFLALSAFALGFAASGVAVADARISESYGRLPLHFEENRGQVHEDVRFLARGPGYGLYLTPREAVLALGAKDQTVLRMALVGANGKPLVSGQEELPGKANYFIGKDSARWRTNVPTYAKVRYREVYPGIDLVYYGNQRQLEYDFVVAPGADARNIVLEFKGAGEIEIDSQGDLVLHAPGGAVRQKKPVIYQEVDGIRLEVAGSYVRRGANRVGFKVAAHDRKRPLIIDPLVLSYSTYLGGSGGESGEGIAVGIDGSAYVTGATGSTDFPTTAGAFQPTLGGNGDVFVAKLNPTGSALVYSSYLGSSSADGAGGIAVDADGYAYVTGSTQSSDFPTTSGAYQPAFSGGFDPLCLCVASDAFVTKLDPTGSSLVYSTYLGGGRPDRSFGIALDADRNAYVTGHTYGSFPTTPGAFQTTFAGGGGPSELGEAYVTKLNSTGSALVYSTYLGGTSGEVSYAIAVDAAGSAYVTGFTESSDFPTTSGAFQTDGSGTPGHAFVTKLNPSGSTLAYSTYLRNGRSFGIAVDAAGSAYVTGWAGSGFPTTPGAFQPTADGFGDGFVTKLNATGSGLVYSTYLGGTDYGRAIAVDTDRNAYVTGSSNRDAFVTKLNSTGSGLVYYSNLGGGSIDEGLGIALAAGNVYVTGYTGSTDFPTTPGAFQPAPNGASETFVAKITAQPPAPYAGTPFPGTSTAVPGTFEAENFDLGGEGVAYHDNVPGNAGGQYRPLEDVDIIISSDPAGGGYVVNNFETGEWLAYSIDVPAQGDYEIELRAATNWDFPNAAYHVEIDGFNVSGSVVLPDTGGWNSFRWVGKRRLSLTAGRHVLKIVTDQQYFNLNAVRVLPSSLGTTRFEESAASYAGYWPTYGAEAGSFSGGTVRASIQTTATATFTFTGTAISWIGVKCNVCGIATVQIDGGAPTVVDTFGSGEPGSLTSEPVFSASGLAPDVTHTLTITVTGGGAAVPAFLTGSAHVAVDAFDVTR